MPVVQDGPPPGGFPAVRYARRVPSTGPTGFTLFAGAAGQRAAPRTALQRSACRTACLPSLPASSSAFPPLPLCPPLCLPAVGAAVMAYGFYQVGQSNRERRAIKAAGYDMRAALVPFLQVCRVSFDPPGSSMGSGGITSSSAPASPGSRLSWRQRQPAAIHSCAAGLDAAPPLCPMPSPHQHLHSLPPPLLPARRRRRTGGG
jgi:hypothetical protein